MRTRLLTAENVKTIVRDAGLHPLMDEVISELDEVLRLSLDENTFAVPKREGFSYSRPSEGLVEWMPVMQHGADVLIKVVGYHPENPALHHIPTVLSSLFLYDTRNGHLKLIADGTLTTSIRTGAASAVASRILAHPESETLGLIGAGAQAVTQLHALSRIFPLRRVLFCDTDEAIERSFAERCAGLELDVELRAESPAALVAEADIVCTVTSVGVGAGPVFADGHLKPWLHVNAVGSDFPGKTELPLSLLRRAHVFPDFRLQAFQEGECQQLTPDDVGPELPALLRQPEDFENLRQELTVFDSTGYALEDHAVLAVVQRHAQRLQLGQDVELESTADPHDPYFGLQEASQSVVQLERAARLLKDKDSLQVS